MTTTPDVALPGLVYAQAADYQARLVALEQAARAHALTGWLDVERATEQALDALLERVEAARAAGRRTSPAWAYQEARYRALLTTVDEQVAAWSTTAEAAAARAQAEAVTLGAQGATATGAAAVGDAAPSLVSTFVQTNPANLRHLAGFTAAGTPLADLFAGIAPDAVDAARRALTTGLALGRSPDRIRRDLQRALRVAPYRAERIVRTEVHRVYRAAARETNMANAHLLEGWVWTAALDARTCPACVAMHGTVHPVDAILDGHPNCRCAMVPRTLPWDALGVEGLEGTRPPIVTGEDWLAAQDPTTQRAVLGPGKYAAYRDGRLTLADVVTRTSDARWGTMRREATLAEALARAEARGNAPAWAAPYGARLSVTDAASPAVRRHLDDLATLPPEAHQALARHLEGAPGGGLYVGDRAVPGLDDLGDLRGTTPRGWPPGSSWDDVAGAYDPARRVVAIGNAPRGHGAGSLALHEASHAVDHALGRVSATPAFTEPGRQFVDWVRPRPYFRPDGNPTGWSSELFAEGFASWVQRTREGLTGDDLGRALVRDLGGADDPTSVQWGVWLADTFRAYLQAAQ